eukprot:15363395-Ditylum_brightwellii.AAC.1
MTGKHTTIEGCVGSMHQFYTTDTPVLRMLKNCPEDGSTHPPRTHFCHQRQLMSRDAKFNW